MHSVRRVRSEQGCCKGTGHASPNIDLLLLIWAEGCIHCGNGTCYAVSSAILRHEFIAERIIKSVRYLEPSTFHSLITWQSHTFYRMKCTISRITNHVSSTSYKYKQIKIKYLWSVLQILSSDIDTQSSININYRSDFSALLSPEIPSISVWQELQLLANIAWKTFMQCYSTTRPVNQSLYSKYNVLLNKWKTRS